MASHSLTVSFLRDMVNGTAFDFSSGTSDTYKCALYTSTAALSYTTTAYSATNEASGTGYTAGGATLTIATNPTIDGRVVYITFANPSWVGSSISARYGLIYKADGAGNPSVAVLDFERTYTTSSGTFTVNMPTKLIQFTVGNME